MVAGNAKRASGGQAVLVTHASNTMTNDEQNVPAIMKMLMEIKCTSVMMDS